MPRYNAPVKDMQFILHDVLKASDIRMCHSYVFRLLCKDLCC